MTINILGTSDAAVSHDFSSDSKSDILWQSSNGTAAVWLLDGTSSTVVGAIGPFNPGPPWHIEGTGDFDGDGKADILWQVNNGTATIWLMDGANHTASSGRSTRGRLARSRASATSTATARPTSCGSTTTARRRSG